MESDKFGFANAVDLRGPSPFRDVGGEAAGAGGAYALEIDLRAGKIAKVRIPDSIAGKYLGGRALAVRLFAEYANGASPKRNPIIIAAGPVNNSLTPFGDSFSIAFQSPVTMRLAAVPSLCGTGACLKSLGLDALVIKETSTLPAVLWIDEDPRIEIRKDLGKLSTSEMESALRSAPRQSIIATGPASENRSPLAAPVCENTTLGRGGLGLLWAEKNIKAVVVSPALDKLAVPLKTKVNDSAPKKEETALRAIAKAVGRSRYLGKAGFNILDKGRRAGFVPVRNFACQTDPRIFYLLSKDEVAKTFHKRRSIASPLLLNQAEQRPWFQLAMLGPNVGCFDLEKTKAWINECIELGLDPISVGNLVGWAINERKMGKLEDYPELEDTGKKNILRIIRRLSNPRGKKLYGLMALGAGALEGSGDLDTGRLFHILGLECGPYDYRGYRAMAIEDYHGTFLTCPCEILMPLYNEKPGKLARFIVWNDNLAEGLESAGFSHLLIGPLLCEGESVLSFLSYLLPSVFLRAFNPNILARRFFEITGKRLRPGAFRDLGKACRLLETGINSVIGAKRPRFPSRFQTETSPAFPKSKPVDFVKLLLRYEIDRLKS